MCLHNDTAWIQQCLNFFTGPDPWATLDGSSIIIIEDIFLTYQRLAHNEINCYSDGGESYRHPMKVPRLRRIKSTNKTGKNLDYYWGLVEEVLVHLWLAKKEIKIELSLEGALRRLPVSLQEKDDTGLDTEYVRWKQSSPYSILVWIRWNWMTKAVCSVYQCMCVCVLCLAKMLRPDGWHMKYGRHFICLPSVYNETNI